MEGELELKQGTEIVLVSDDEDGVDDQQTAEGDDDDETEKPEA